MPPSKANLWQQFDRNHHSAHKLSRARCKHCKHELVGQANRAERHLDQCGPYHTFLAATEDGSSSTSEPARSAQKKVDQYPHRCSPMDQKAHDRRLGMAVFAGGLPFHVFDKTRCIQMWEFIHELNRAYQIPGRHAVADQLLPQYYSETREKVQKLLQSVQYLNFVADESDDKAKRRICNLSVNAPSHGTFFIKNYWTGAQRQSASFIADTIMPGIDEACNLDVLRVNSIATDTCSTMRSLHTKMAQNPRFSHVFFVLCDSHGIQLLIKAILDLPYYASILRRAQIIVGAFSKSRLQLAILREIQQEKYGRTIALVLSVITRWGTQYRIFESLLRSRDALRHYSVDERAQLQYERQEIKHWLHDAKFWGDVECMEELLRPLHQAQKMSESDNAHIGLVTKRWLAIKATLQHCYESGRFPGLEPVISPTGIWATLYDQQTTAIHFTAFYLDPMNLDMPMTQRTTDQVFDFMRRYIDPNHCDELWNRVLEDFYAFRNQQLAFNPHSRDDIWSSGIIAKPIIFWQRNRHRALELATFALRIFHTPANSVPSERSFSAMNYILHKNRTKLSADRSEQSIYIYMNERALRKSYEMESRSWANISDNDAVSIEDDVLEFMEGKEAIDHLVNIGNVAEYTGTKV